MTEPPDKDFYKTIKVPLKHIIKNFEINQPKINDLTIMAHKAINKIDRPSYLCRRNNSDTLEEVSHP
jgi:hypothetical protein